MTSLESKRPTEEFKHRACKLKTTSVEKPSDRRRESILESPP
jgi:hypothetical protein